MASLVAPLVRRRPRDFPSTLARARPLMIRSWIMARSNSANTPLICSSARPDGVELVDVLLVQIHIDAERLKSSEQLDQVLQAPA